jgi:predicted PurR-regulated permease PerM
VATVLLVLLVIILPMIGLVGIITAEALDVTERVRPWVEYQIQNPDELDRLLQRMPFIDQVAPYKAQVSAKLAEFAARLGTFIVNAAAATGRGTAVFFFQLFIMLYAMFIFLLDGPRLLNKILYYVPLTSADENRMVARFLSVTRATLKGTLVIGIIQGALGGLSFWVVGIEGAVFWATIMAVMSIIPGVGTGLVWVPAVIYLFAAGQTGPAIGLTVWNAAVVGSVDNVLRPWLVGKDTQMPDLLVLLGTLGGIVLFGASGIVIGPVIAALFVTVWEIYGETYREILPERS